MDHIAVDQQAKESYANRLVTEAVNIMTTQDRAVKEGNIQAFNNDFTGAADRGSTFFKEVMDEFKERAGKNGLSVSENKSWNSDKFEITSRDMHIFNWTTMQADLNDGKWTSVTVQDRHIFPPRIAPSWGTGSQVHPENGKR